VPLFAPLAVAVEIREERPDDARRVFRLSRSIADAGILLERPAPFEVDQPVTATFRLPDPSTRESLCLRAIVALTDSDGDGSKGGAELVFLNPSQDARQAILRYVAGRLGLPSAESRR
jgi:PilZ domain